MNKPCSVPGCTEAGVVKVEQGQWLCEQHLNVRLHDPANMALTQASQDLEDFTDGGGKPS